MADITPGSRVELLADRENVYRFAKAGARATVLDERDDDYGYRMVYVEWDDGVSEPDCWTFASHFKILSGPSADELIRKAEDSRPRCPTCGQLDEPENDQFARHVDILMAATELAGTAEGYMVITMEKKVNPNGDTYVTPKVFLSTLTPLGAAVVESQVVKMAHMYHHERIEAAITDVIKREDNGR